MKAKILVLFLLFCGSLFSQTPGTTEISFASRFRITDVQVGVADTLIITGFVDECAARFTNSDIEIADSLYILEGSDLIILGVVTDPVLSLGSATFKALDYNTSGVIPSAGEAAIFRPTGNYKFPGHVCGLNDNLDQYINSRFIQRLDAVLSGIGGGGTDSIYVENDSVRLRDGDGFVDLLIYKPDSTLFATVYRTDTLAQNIRDEIAALPDENTNIYNADGSLTGNRVMTIGSNNLALQNSASASAGRIRLNGSGDLLLRSDEDGATTIVGGTSVKIESTDLINIEADGNLTLESEEDIELWADQVIIGGMDDEYVPTGDQHGVFTVSGEGRIQRSPWSLTADSLSAYLPDSTIFATVYRTDTLAQNIRDEIAALPDENTNIYNTDGDLIGDREIDLKGYDLTISNGFEDDEAHFNLSNNSTNFWWSGDGQHISILASGGTFMSGADIYLTAHTTKFYSHILQESSFTSKFRNRVGIGALFSETVAPTVRLHITENSSQNNSALYTTDDILVLENSQFSPTESVNFVLTPAAQGFAGFQVLDRAEETRNRFGYNMLSGDWEVFDFSDNNFMSFNENRLKHTNYGSGGLLTTDFTHLLTANENGEFSEASWEVVADSISNYIDEDQGFWYDTGFGIATDEYAVMNNAASVIGNFDVSTDGSINFVLNDGDDINTIQMTDGKTTIMTSDTVSIHALKKENETDGLPTNIIAAADGTGTLLRHSIDNLKTALDVNNVFRTVAYADLSAGAADTLATGVFDEYRHLRIIIYVDSISAAERVHLVFNDDHTVENYRGRFTANWGGGTEYLSAEGIRLEQTSHSSSRFIVVDIYNAETMPKLVQTSCVQNGLTSSNTVGTWLNNTEMITSCKLVLSDPAVMQAGTTITVLGMN